MLQAGLELIVEGVPERLGDTEDARPQHGASANPILSLRCYPEPQNLLLGVIQWLTLGGYLSVLI